ncbi:MAG: STAS domain-containing protein [Gemmatimonadaceae bacterium]|jgi:anti-sigma B factor antagonist|nr:STAS domain-containing protein [Gemmatimonadaceae bacterium]
MSFTLARTDDRLLVDVDGQLVVANRQEFKQAVLDEVEQGARLVVVDFTKSAYIDSSGLGALVSLGKRLREIGGDLRLAGLNDDLRTLFELTRLDALFPLYATRADALAGT